MAKATKKTNISLVSSEVYGIVKWFNKGNGRISIKDYGDVFVHFSQIKKAAPKCYIPQKFLVKGQTVKCDLLSGPKGLQARKVIVVIDTPDDDKQSVSSDITDSTSVCEDYYESSSDSDEDEPAKTHNILERDLRGEVLSYFVARGFGFVKTHQYGNIFCHSTDIIFSGEGTSEKKLTPTQFVKCDVARGSKGLMAVNVHVICEANPVATDGDRQTSPARRDRDPSASRQPKKSEGTAKAPKQKKAEKQPKNDPTKGKPQPQKPAEPPKKQPTQKALKATSTSDPSKGDSAKQTVLQSGLLGEVLFYNTVKGFGFIKVPTHDGPIFVHKNCLNDKESLQKDQYVKFDVVKGPKTLMAVNIKVISDAKMPTVDKNESEPKQEESKAKKKKKAKPQDSSIPQLMSNPFSAMSSEKPPRPPMAPPTAPFNPNYQPLIAPNYPYPNYPYPHPCMQELPMRMPGPPPSAFGPPPPYMAQPPSPMRPPAPPPQNMIPPSYPGQMTQMLDNTHISLTKDPFVKPQDPKASCDRRVNEEVTKVLTCGICEDLLEDPVITPCEHLFCRGCLLEWLPYQGQCPIDRKTLSKEMIKDAPKVIKKLCKT